MTEALELIAIIKKPLERKIGLYRCFCGKEFEARVSNVKSGNTKSCGCLNGGVKHGYSGSLIYQTWGKIKRRCYNPNSKAYQWYGAIGIKMYEGWLNNPLAFIDYVSHLPGYGVKGLTLDRINNNGNYEPGNLRWATWVEQANNKGHDEFQEKGC